MLKLEQAVLVEGKYDAARLTNLVDATILTTDGSRVFRDKELQNMLKRIAAAQGLIILTDSDDAGFRIRHFVTGLVGAEHVLQAYVPAVHGKEARKQAPGKEGLLGVEGIADDLILQGLQTALDSAPAPQTTAQDTDRTAITYTDLYEWGISGTANSADRRRALLARLGLPPRLSKKELLQVLNTLYTWESLDAQIENDGIKTNPPCVCMTDLFCNERVYFSVPSSTCWQYHGFSAWNTRPVRWAKRSSLILAGNFNSHAHSAWYFSRSSRLAALLPYLLSPKMGQPICAKCARIWWVRPVTSSTSSRASRPLTASVS